MPEFETVSDQVGLLRDWVDFLPGRITAASGGEISTAKLGERHGSWVLWVDWESGGLLRSAELALTNPDPTPDTVATSVVVSVRASASNADRFVFETVYERRRGASRLSSEQFVDWLATAVARANEYRVGSLTDSYASGSERSQ